MGRAALCVWNWAFTDKPHSPPQSQDRGWGRRQTAKGPKGPTG